MTLDINEGAMLKKLQIVKVIIKKTFQKSKFFCPSANKFIVIFQNDSGEMPWMPRDTTKEFPKQKKVEPFPGKS